MSQAAEGYSRAEAEKYIRDSSSAWAESVATNDASVVKRILAEDFVWVREGEVLDKRRAVTGAQQGPGDFVSNHLDYANVRFFGDTAVVQGAETWTRTGGRSGHCVFIDTWVRRGGIWQIVAAVDVTAPLPSGHSGANGAAASVGGSLAQATEFGPAEWGLRSIPDTGHSQFAQEREGTLRESKCLQCS